MIIKKFVRNCPTCSKELIYKGWHGWNKGNKLNSLCSKCAVSGNKNPFFGKSHSKFTKNKLSNIAKNRTNDEIAIRIKNFTFKGQKHSIETKEKIRQANTGVKFSEMRCNKISSANRITYSKIWTAKGRNPFYNKNACEFFDFLNIINNWNGQHAENGGEVCIEGYWLDYYEPTLNLVIEWDEKYHQRKLQRDKDIKKEKLIKVKLNCIFLRITELNQGIIC